MLLDIVKKGTTDYSVVVRFVDSADGTPETGVVAATAGLSISYRRGAADGGTQGTLTSIGSITNLATLATAHTDAGILHIGNGYYRVDLPDAAIASGAQYCEIVGTATDMIMMGGRILLTAISFQTLANMGMTALPAVAPQAAGGLITSTAGSLDVDTLDSNVSAILADTGTDGVVVATASKTGYRLSSTGVDDIWDEAYSGHLTAGSTGAAVGGQIAVSGTVQTGGNYSTTVELPSAAVAVDGYYDDMVLEVIGGTGVGQSLFIDSYVGSTQIATMNGTFATTLDATSIVQVRKFGSIPGASAPTTGQIADAVWDEVITGGAHDVEGSAGQVLQPAQVGTAQAGGTTSITLDATGASATTDAYKYSIVKLVAGTGAGQSRQISAYNGSTKVATVSLAWTTGLEPDATTEYVILNDFGIDAATVDSIADAVWDEPRSEHILSDTFGQFVNSDTVRISGSAPAADALEAATTGATPLPANVTQVGGVAQDLPTATNMQTIDDNVDAILLDTGTTLPGLIAALNDISVSDVLTTQMTESYATDGTAPTLAQAVIAIQQFLFDKSVSGTTLTVQQLDGTTTAMTFTLDNGTTPTDINRTG